MRLAAEKKAVVNDDRDLFGFYQTAIRNVWVNLSAEAQQPYIDKHTRAKTLTLTFDEQREYVALSFCH